MLKLAIEKLLVSLILSSFFVSSFTIRSVTVSRESFSVASLVGDTFTYGGSSIACVKNCLERECFSAVYWKQERKCRINLSPPENLVALPDGDIRWYIFKNPASYTFYESIGKWLVYRPGPSNWHGAKSACEGENPPARLFQVDSQLKQDVARDIALIYGTAYVHIGVYYDLVIFPPWDSKWRYIDGTEVSYTKWGSCCIIIQEPKFLTWGSLASSLDYDWAATELLLSAGAWICERS